jgi:hypothetical protein
MRGCPNHPTVFTMHPSGICAICRAAADAGPTAISPPYSIPAAAHEPPADCDGYEGAITTDHCLNCGQALYAHSNEALRTLFDINRRDGKPPDNSVPQAIPDTARRILDMGRTQQAAPVPQQPADPRAEGIARAVDRLSQRDDAYMPAASRFHP